MNVRVWMATLVTLALIGCGSAPQEETGSSTFRLEAGDTAQDRGVRGYEISVVDEYRTVVKLLADDDAPIGTATIRVDQDGSHSEFVPSDGGPTVDFAITARGFVLTENGAEVARFQRTEDGVFQPVGDAAAVPSNGLAYLMTALLDDEVRGFMPSAVEFTWWTNVDDCDPNLASGSCGFCSSAWCGPLMYIFWPWMIPGCQSQCGICAFCQWGAY